MGLVVLVSKSIFHFWENGSHSGLEPLQKLWGLWALFFFFFCTVQIPDVYFLGSHIGKCVDIQRLVVSCLYFPGLTDLKYLDSDNESWWCKLLDADVLGSYYFYVLESTFLRVFKNLIASPISPLLPKGREMN